MVLWNPLHQKVMPLQMDDSKGKIMMKKDWCQNCNLEQCLVTDLTQLSFSFLLSFELLPLALEGFMVILMKGKTIHVECYFVNSEKKIKGPPTIAPSLASSSPNSSARFDTACVTLSTLICSLYVNQWFYKGTEPSLKINIILMKLKEVWVQRDQQKIAWSVH